MDLDKSKTGILIVEKSKYLADRTDTDQCSVDSHRAAMRAADRRDSEQMRTAAAGAFLRFQPD
jgi:hypothetical protein